MRVLLQIMAAGAFLWGAGVLWIAKGSVHEVYGAVMLLAGAMCAAAAGVLAVLERLEDVQRELLHELKMQRPVA